jgi:alkylation response protein AidB-like acyl-CoA dehydrogenase
VGLQAKQEGEGWSLSGAKRLVSDAVDADLFLVSARTGDGPALFLVPASSPGITVAPHHTLDLTRTLAEVAFDAVSVDCEARLPVQDGAAALERALQIAIVLQCGESLGVAEALMDMTVEYSKGREQFGRPIGSFQAIRHKCADMRVALDGIRTLTRYAALAVQDRFEDAAEAVHAAKSHVGEATAFMSGEALQIHGGVGFTWEYDVHLFLRRAKCNQVLWGDPAWHNERIAEQLLLER